MASSDKSFPFADIAFAGTVKTPYRYKGAPSISFSEDEIKVLSARFYKTIVGRFTSVRPALARIRLLRDRIGFDLNLFVSLLEECHILINFSSDNDFLRCLLRKSWRIDRCIMKVFRWTPDFDAEAESPLLPVWIALEGLPIHLFESTALYSIANLIGRPLCTDTATENLTKPSVARVCVELDLSKEIPKAILVHLGKLSFFQPVYFEDLPDFCSSCNQFGHTNCKKGVRPSRWTRRDVSSLKTVANPQGLNQPGTAKPLQQQQAAQMTDLQQPPTNVDSVIDTIPASNLVMVLPLDNNAPLATTELVCNSSSCTEANA